MIQRRVWVSGKVQGVSFRASTAQEARQYSGLKGWVRNLEDGRVEAVFCGLEAHVEAMIEFCHHGPRSAEVREVEVEEEKVDSTLPLFEVREDL